MHLESVSSQVLQLELHKSHTIPDKWYPSLQDLHIFPSIQVLHLYGQELHMPEDK